MIIEHIKKSVIMSGAERNRSICYSFLSGGFPRQPVNALHKNHYVILSGAERSRSIFCLFLLSLALLFHRQTSAQGVGTEEVIVVKEYEIKIADADKVTIQPAIPETEEKKPVLDYNIPAREFKDIAFEANPLKPLSLSREKLEKFNNSFIKIGMGSQLMPIAQLAYNDNKTKNLKFGIFYNHLSAREYKKIRNQRFSDDEAGVYLKYYPAKTEIGVDFTFRNYRTHFYGTAGDTSLSDSVIKAKNVRQVFRTYDANVWFKNSQKNKYELDYKQSFRFNYLQETYGKANEWFVQGNSDISKPFLKYHSAGFNFLFDVSQLKRDTFTLTRTIFTPMVGYSFNNDDWKVRGYFGLTVNGKKPVFATDIHAEKRLYEHMLILFVQYSHNLLKNSLLTHSQTNNFIHNSIEITNSTVGDLGAGFKGTIEGFSYNAAFHLNHVTNLPLYVNDTLDMKRFTVLYVPKALVYNVHLEAGYNVKEWLRFALVGNYNIYGLRNQARAWHEPNLRLTFRANYIWKNKIVAGIELFGITSSYARLTGDTERKLKGTADINVTLEYIMNKHIAFFAGGNNLANFKYQRWNNYPSYGIMGWIGAKFSF